MRLALLTILMLIVGCVGAQSEGVEHVYNSLYLHQRAPLDAKFIAQDTINVTAPYEGQITFFVAQGKHLTYVGGRWQELTSEQGDTSSDFALSDSGVSNADWNTFTSPGMQAQRANGDAANGPGVNGLYYVVNYTNPFNTDLFQKALPVNFEDGHAYFRTNRIGVWSEWTKADDGRVIDTESVDWNTVVLPGLYKNIVRGDQPNGPGGSVFYYIRNVGRNGNVFQEALPYSGVPTDWQVRVFFGGSWGPWEDVIVTKASLSTSPDVSTSTDFNTVTAPGLHTAILRGTNTNGPGPGSFYFVQNTIRNFAIYQTATRYGNTTSDGLHYARTRNSDGSGTWTAWERLDAGQLGDGMGDNDAGGNEVTNAAPATAPTSLTTLQQLIDSLDRFKPITVHINTDTTRTSSTASAFDSLGFIDVNAGTYQVKVLINYDSDDNAGGIGWNFSATNLSAIPSGYVRSSSADNETVPWTLAATDGVTQANKVHQLRLTGNVVFTADDSTFTFQFGTDGTGNVTVLRNSWITLTPKSR